MNWGIPKNIDWIEIEKFDVLWRLGCRVIAVFLRDGGVVRAWTTLESAGGGGTTYLERDRLLRQLQRLRDEALR